jgi:hypothetical protein
MSRFDALAQRLPSAWRPDDADVGLPLTLAPDQVVGVDGDGGPLAATLTASGTSVLVSLPRRVAIRTIRLVSGAAQGTGYLLHLRTLRGDQTPVVPTAIAPVQGSSARVGGTMRAARFTITLVRRPLIGVVVQAVADVLDAVAEDAATVQQSHWYRTADHAVTHPYVVRLRRAEGLPPLSAGSPGDRSAIEQFANIDALGRLAGLLGIAPYESPPSLRETVETFRRRVGAIVELYRGGLGTLDALARMVDTCLPHQAGDRRPFTVEEHAAVARRAVATTAGPPDGVVGPLMRWAVANDGLAPASGTLLVIGSQPLPGQIGPTVNPIVQLHAAGDRPVDLGLAWRGTVAAGQALRVRPTATSWLGGDNGLLAADRQPATDTADTVDPTAPGPWEPFSGGPPGTVTALCQTADGALWAGVDDGQLWRYDGRSWTAVRADLPPVAALASTAATLLVGTAAGLAAGRIHPPGDELLALDTPGPDAAAVHAIAVLGPDDWLIASADGLRAAGPDNLAGTAVGPVVADGSEPVVTALYVDRHGVRWLGLDDGLVVHQPGLDHWYGYLGGDIAESTQWAALEVDDSGRPVLPDPATVFLPPVRAIHRDVDEALWLGTDHGLARWYARPIPGAGLSSTTVLEAFPELGEGPVHTLALDPRGGLWIGAGNGLFRYRGRDLEQHQGVSGWVRLGRPETLPDDSADPRPRGEWRFDRATGDWQRWSLAAGRRFIPEPVALRASPQPPVTAVAWTAGAFPDLLDGFVEGAFTAATPVDPGTLSMRWQPEPIRIVDGGIPAVPAVPSGRSEWRYLRGESADDVLPPRRPAWTAEGRLLPLPLNRPAPPEARFDRRDPLPPRVFDASVFPYPPAARVELSWPSPQPLSVLVRLERQTPDEAVDPVVLDRVWAGMQQVRPAGVVVRLAVDEDIVRGAP